MDDILLPNFIPTVQPDETKEQFDAYVNSLTMQELYDKMPSDARYNITDVVDGIMEADVSKIPDSLIANLVSTMQVLYVGHEHEIYEDDALDMAKAIIKKLRFTMQPSQLDINTPFHFTCPGCLNKATWSMSDVNDGGCPFCSDCDQDMRLDNPQPIG